MGHFIGGDYAGVIGVERVEETRCGGLRSTMIAQLGGGGAGGRRGHEFEKAGGSTFVGGGGDVVGCGGGGVEEMEAEG